MASPERLTGFGRLRSPALIAIALGLGCIQDDGTRMNPFTDFVTVNQSEEREAGFQADVAISQHVRLIDDPLVAGFINDLGQDVVHEIEPQPFLYNFRVIEDPRLNAFALPAGFIYLHSETILSAGSIDELVGVIAHEVAHVKRRHHARAEEKMAIPNLISSLGGAAVSVATRDPTAAVVAPAANVALRLHFQRAFESEADESGVIFMTRAGYDPQHVSRFFDRILQAERQNPIEIPPYLYSHPDVEDRKAYMENQTDGFLRNSGRRRVNDAEFHAIQTRLSFLIESDRTTLPSKYPSPKRHLTQPYLDQAEKLLEQGRLGPALTLFEEGEAAEPHDPRVPFRRGEALVSAGRHREATSAYLRALHLQPGTALTHLRLADAYKASGDRVHAFFYYDQAMRRFQGRSSNRKRAGFEIEKLVFPVVANSGFADGTDPDDSNTVAGWARERFEPADETMAWWAQIGSHFVPHRKRMSVRWTDPAGNVVQEERVDRRGRVFVASALELSPEVGEAGVWEIALLLEGDVVEQSEVTLAR